ncbi:MAG: DUF4861 domain-containing protein [Niabella sp.]
MKTFLSFLSLLFLAGSPQRERVSTLTLENPLSIERLDEAIVFTREQLNPTGDLLPTIANRKGENIPCQLDDLDGDGRWDELAFVYSFHPREKIPLQILWVKKDSYPNFPRRTNIRFGKLNGKKVLVEMKSDFHTKDQVPGGVDYRGPYPYQMDGPAWENDKMGFRQYFDGRNSRDVFGKRIPDMVLDTVGILPNGHPGDTYHVLHQWGRDIMSAANSFGLGGIALQTPDSLIRMGIPAGWKQDVVDSTRYTLITEGTARSILRLDYYGWQVSRAKIDISEEITIWAGKYGYENKVKATGLPFNSYLVTGIVANNNDKPFSEKKHDGKLLSMLTHDKQTYNKEYYMGMALILPLDNVKETYHALEKNADIQKTWCVKMNPDREGIYRYNVYATWELADVKFKERDSFVNLIDYYAQCINNPIIIRLKP